VFHAADDRQDLLFEWRWLIGEDARLVGWSEAADLFFSDAGGAVSRVDTGSGDHALLATSVAQCQSMLSDRRQAGTMLMLPIVQAFEQTHGPLRAGTCLGFKKLPVFGGTYTIENRYAVSMSEHAAFTGDVHRQIRDLPDGAQIIIKTVP
jgi:hypothetical protein